MECETEIEKLQPTITREQEAALYKFLRDDCEDDALRYELIAKKIHRAADGTAVAWELAIVRDWLSAMNAARVAAEPVYVPLAPQEAPFAAVRRGQVGNPNYQAFLDTLEQCELDAIDSNVPYFGWFSDRQAEARKLVVPGGPDWLRKWADHHLSERVKSQRLLAT